MGKSLKRENIATLNKADKAACRAWVNEEKKHREDRRRREEEEEQEEYRKCVDVKMGKLDIETRTQELLRELAPKDALDLLDKAGDRSNAPSANEFLLLQANLMLQGSGSEAPASKRLKST